MAWVIALAAGASVPYPAVSGGVVAQWSAPWRMAWPGLNAALGLAVNIALAVALVQLNGVFNLLRSITRLQAAAFLLIQMSVPAIVAYATPAVVTAAAVVACMALMFSVYASGGPLGMRRVFLVFLILSAGSAIAWPCVLYIPVMLLGCAQMRVFSLRTLLAAGMGIATPWIIILGFGMASPSDIHWPAAPGGRTNGAVAAVGLSAFAAVACWLLNAMKYLTYNAHSRAMISLVTVTTGVTVIAAAARYADALSLLPMLNVCAALQLGHLFGVIHTGRRSFIGILLCLLPFVLLGIWNSL